MNRWGEPKLALLLALAIVLSIAGLWAGLRLIMPAPVAPALVSVTLTVEAAGWGITYEAASTNNTVLSFLLEAATAHDFGVQYQHSDLLGASRVTVINGIRDGTGGLFWLYWVNGFYGQVGADRYILADGDAVLWRHTSPPSEA